MAEDTEERSERCGMYDLAGKSSGKTCSEEARKGLLLSICEPNCPPNLPAINQQQRQPACNSSCNNNHLDSEVPSRSFVVAAQACCVYLRRQRCCRPYTPFRVVHGVPRVPHAARGRGAPVQRGPASSPRTLLTPTLKPQPLTLTL